MHSTGAFNEKEKGYGSEMVVPYCKTGNSHSELFGDNSFIKLAREGIICGVDDIDMFFSYV